MHFPFLKRYTQKENAMRTSITLLYTNIEKLFDACIQCNTTHSEIINLCLRKFFAAHPKLLDVDRPDRTVEYQPKGMGYVILTLVFDVDVFNLSVFFRAFCRVSVSALVTKAIAAHFDEVVRELEGEEKVPHNYVDYKLCMRHNGAKNMPEWSINWELEEKQTPT